MSASDSTSPLLAPALLLGFGATAAVQLGLGRVAIEAGVAATALAFWLTLGAGLVMFGAAGARAAREWRVSHLRFAIVAAALGVATPRALVYVLIPYLGNGASAVFYTLSPLCTALAVRALAGQSLSWMRGLGICVGVAGALLITGPRVLAATGAPRGAMVLGLTIPVSIAIGNLYRDLRWPAGATPHNLGTLVNLVAAAELLVFTLVSGHALLPAGAGVRGLVALVGTALVGAGASRLFWELQRAAGAVYLSQAGLWITAFSLAIGVAWFGEHHGAVAWLGVVLVVVGQLLFGARTSRAGEAAAACS